MLLLMAYLLREIGAERSGQMKELIARINSELAKNHSDLTLSFTETFMHIGRLIFPENDPYSYWNTYDLQLKRDSGKILDEMHFDGTVRGNPGYHQHYC